jgi:hypothetical protein
LIVRACGLVILGRRDVLDINLDGDDRRLDAFDDTSERRPRRGRQARSIDGRRDRRE